MNGSSSWLQGLRDGDAAALHANDLPVVRGAWLMRPTRAAFVLGSSQAADDIDEEFCASQGIDVARRRSGGGAVFVHPTDSVWIDVTIPRGDDLWVEDVGRAMHVVGRAWCEVLGAAGMGDLVMNEGPYVATELSKHVCFAGRGSGEVFQVVGVAGVTGVGTKVIGISQRRTREVARFQCIGYFTWHAEAHVGAIRSLSGESSADRLAAIIPHRAPAELLDALVGALAQQSH